MNNYSYTRGITDIRTIQIDISKPVKERLQDYISQVRNPYRLKMGDTIIEMSYEEHAKPISELLAELSF